jgi:hypothetical protein
VEVGAGGVAVAADTPGKRLVGPPGGTKSWKREVRADDDATYLKSPVKPEGFAGALCGERTSPAQRKSCPTQRKS